MLSWKYTHPCSLEHMAAAIAEASGGSGSGGSANTATASATAATLASLSAMDGVEYARVLRYNLSRQELSVLVDCISMIKTLSSLMARAEATLSPYIRFHVHHRIQQLVQVGVGVW